MADIEALTSAFVQLLPTVEADRAEKVLRSGIAALVARDDRRLISRSPPIAGADIAAWDRLKAEIRATGVKLVDLAREIEMPLPSLQKTLSPQGRPDACCTIGWRHGSPGKTSRRREVPRPSRKLRGAANLNYVTVT
jgi:hypothetical protein